MPRKPSIRKRGFTSSGGAECAEVVAAHPLFRSGERGSLPPNHSGGAMGAFLMWLLIVGLFIVTTATFGWIGAVAWAIAWLFVIWQLTRSVISPMR
jgi:hypothetical protein